jgi:putative transposase
VERAAELIEPQHPQLSMRTQCKLLGVARSSLDYVPVAEDAADARLKRILDELYLCDPCLGSRRLVAVLERDHGMEVNRKRLQRLRREMGLEAIWCKPRTSQPDKQHTVHPYLLRGKEISRPDEVWCTDITYVPMPRGHAFLCAVMDWSTRCVLGWAVGNTMDVALCLLALERAVARAGCVPGIFNTDQGSQFTSREWTGRLTELGVQISMDGRGRWMDNVFIERLWRSIKYEEIYLREHADVAALTAGVAAWMKHYNGWRPHQALGNKTPLELYRPGDSHKPPVAVKNPAKKAA